MEERRSKNKLKSIDMKKFELMALPYAPEALEPVISKETIGFHHGKHLQAYVDNLNKLLPGSEYEGMALERIVQNRAKGACWGDIQQCRTDTEPRVVFHTV